jgi:hypothetical protein
MQQGIGKFGVAKQDQNNTGIFASPIYSFKVLTYVPEQLLVLKVLFSDCLTTWLRPFYFSQVKCR